MFLLALLLLSAAKPAAGAPAAAAEPSAPSGPALEADQGQRAFGFVVNLGTYDGIGLGLQARGGSVGLRASVGYAPVLVAFRTPDSSGNVKLRVFSGFMLAPDAFVDVFQGRENAHAGLQLGYRFHDLLGHGFAIGGFGTFRLSRALDLLVQGGLVVFPDGESRLREKKPNDLPSGTDFSIPGPSIDGAVSVGLAIFPL